MADAPKHLSREQMEQVIKNKGSVLWNGQVISTIAELPTEADLATGSTARIDQARENLLERKRLLEAELVKLEHDQGAAEKEAKEAEKVRAAQAKDAAKAEKATEAEEEPKPAHAPAHGTHGHTAHTATPHGQHPHGKK